MGRHVIESMTRLRYQHNNGAWVIRVWVEQTSYQENYLETNNTLQDILNRRGGYKTKADLATAIVNGHHGLTINDVEVLDELTGNGICVYPDWP